MSQPDPRHGIEVSREPWLGAQVLSYPDRPPTVLDVLDHAVREHGDRVGIVDGAEQLTYAAFADRVEGAAARMRAAGLQPGDRVGLALRNSVDLAVAVFACVRAGLVMVGLSTRLQAPQWAYILRHAGVRCAIAPPDLSARLKDAAAQAGLSDDAVVGPETWLSAPPRPWAYADADAPAASQTYAVVYTSGTTGDPKGSQVVHRCSVHSAMTYAHVLGLRPEDRTAVLFPLTYITGLHAHVLPMMLVGGVSVLLAESSPGEYVAALRHHRITWAYTVPSFWQMLLRREDFASPDLDHVRLAAFGGSPFPGSVLDALRARLPNAALHDIYGLTETHSPATMLFDHEFAAKPGSVGRPLPCMEARVVDEEGAEVAAGEAGELLLRGSLVTTGYYRDPAATAAAIRDGWLHTGDAARMDDDGYVWILDRLKDQINRGGHKISSVAVEQLLMAHPAVTDAAVVGVSDGVAGEAVACFVVPSPGAEVGRSELRRWVADRMADYAAPRHIRLVESIPRNPTGKILKAQLRERLRDELG